MKELEERTLLNPEFRKQDLKDGTLQERIMETQLVKRNLVEELKDDMKNEEIEEEKKPNFEAQNPLVEVNLGTEKEPITIKVSGLLLEESQSQLVQLIKKY